MNEPLDEARDYIFDLYHQLLGQEIEVASQFPTVIAKPVWLSINANFDLVSSTEAPKGSLLVDPELGTCLFLQEFESQMDIRPQITRALRMQSRLRPKQISGGFGVDQYGEWKIVIHWLVGKESFSDWEKQVSELRRETAHFEEIPVDAVVNWDDNWAMACSAHGFPRLLVRTRESMLKKSEAETFSWMSADEKIADKIRGLPGKAESETERAKALELVDFLETLVSTAVDHDQEVADPKPLDQIRIQNFRNIRDLEMHFSKDSRGVGCHVIQGPNGSGKSSIFEAISLGSSKVSGRLVDYVDDGNVATREKVREYASKYLTSLSEDSAQPMISLNDAKLTALELEVESDPRELVRGVSGTFLSQSVNDDLLRSGAKELGAIIAGDYSTISEKVLSYISERQTLSEARRQGVNQKWGMRSNISKIGTAKERITELVLESEIPNVAPLTAWLASCQFGDFEGLEYFVHAKSVWETYQKHRQQLPIKISKSTSTTENTELLISHLHEYQSALDLVGPLVAELGLRSSRLEPDFLANFELYAAWLRRENTTSSESEEVTNLKKVRAEAQAQMQDLSSAGRALANRLKHLEAAASFIEREWSVSHPDICPTCDTNLSERAGILNVMKQTVVATGEDVARARDRYRQARDRADEAFAELQRLGADEVPVHRETIHELHEFVGAVFRVEQGPEQFIKEVNLDLVVSFISKLQKVPSVTSRGVENVESLASSIVERLKDSFDEFSLTSKEPDAWKAINSRFLGELTETMNDHLPSTVQALWLELSRNMSSAPWQMKGDVRFSLQTKRGSAEATIVVKGGERSALAAHILNGAETHNLTVAWFLTRYLTFGRFHYTFLALDDPAQQMDQPTFRDLCRLLEGILRVHRWHHVPVTMLVFLHQDERALDAARATNATLHLLRWNRSGPDLLKSMRMHSEDFGPAAPSIELFRKASVVGQG